MAENWRNRKERSNALAMRILVWLTQRLGRRVAALVMWPITGYFLLFAGGARRGARNWLNRVLGRPATWRDIWRQLYFFGITALDRVHFFGGRFELFQIEKNSRQLLYDTHAKGRGFILIVSHLGSMEAMRTLGSTSAININILMDRAAGQKANQLLDAINPELTHRIIDTSKADVDLVLKIKAVLDKGEIVGIMADRLQPGQKSARCDFLGGKADFPTSPWILAGLLKVPVVLGFGLYQGGNRYALHFELFADQLDMPRRSRQQAVAACAQRYADRLAHYGALAPYNWFNFFDFWHDE